MQKKFLLRCLLSLGPLGHLPKASGTWASLMALLPLGLLNFKIPAQAWYLLFSTAILTILGVAGWRYLEINYPDEQDPSWLVLDEVVGQWLSVALTMLMLPIIPLADDLNLTLGFWCGQFALFRLFDILKPWPISWADQQSGALWVFLDDLLAGAGAALTYFLLEWARLSLHQP